MWRKFGYSFRTMATTTTLVAMIVSVMMSLAPVGRRQYVPEAQESRDQAMDRYADIAQSMIDVSFDPTVRPLFQGNEGRLRTLALVFSVAYHESGFRLDVDTGLGRGRLARSGWNDYGRSWCMMQISLGRKQILRDGAVVEHSAAQTNQGWSGPDLLQDRQKCFKAGIEVLRASMMMCQKNHRLHRLAGYASGSCDRGLSLSESRVRNSDKVREALRRLGWPIDSWASPTRSALSRLSSSSSRSSGRLHDLLARAPR